MKTRFDSKSGSKDVWRTSINEVGLDGDREALILAKTLAQGVDAFDRVEPPSGFEDRMVARLALGAKTVQRPAPVLPLAVRLRDLFRMPQFSWSVAGAMAVVLVFFLQAKIEPALAPDFVSATAQRAGVAEVDRWLALVGDLDARVLAQGTDVASVALSASHGDLRVMADALDELESQMGHPL